MPITVLGLAFAMPACSPTLDWREVRPSGAGLVTLFPCKPASQTRQLVLAGAAVEMALFACAAGGATYAVGVADMGQPQRVEHALVELVAAAARNIGAAAAPSATPVRVEGMTPNPQALRHAFAGRLGNGQPVHETVAVFARGTRVFQATVVGARLDGDAVETFFGALRLPR